MARPEKSHYPGAFALPQYSQNAAPCKVLNFHPLRQSSIPPAELGHSLLEPVLVGAVFQKPLFHDPVEFQVQLVAVTNQVKSFGIQFRSGCITFGYIFHGVIWWITPAQNSCKQQQGFIKVLYEPDQAEVPLDISKGNIKQVLRTLVETVFFVETVIPGQPPNLAVVQLRRQSLGHYIRQGHAMPNDVKVDVIGRTTLGVLVERQDPVHWIPEKRDVPTGFGEHFVDTESDMPPQKGNLVPLPLG